MSAVVVEADGGSRGNPGIAGSGAVVIDPATGEILAERAVYVGIATNNVAEYRGLIAGLTAAAEVAPSRPIHVRLDSKLVVEQMSGHWKVKHPDMQVLHAEARSIITGQVVTFEWVPRLQNGRADALANKAMDDRADYSA